MCCGSGIFAAAMHRQRGQTLRGQRPFSAGGLAARAMRPAAIHDAHIVLFRRGMGAGWPRLVPLATRHEVATEHFVSQVRFAQALAAALPDLLAQRIGSLGW